jgi:WD40 repeat protein
VVATGGADGTVTLFDASTGRQLTAVEAVHAKPVTALAAWADDAVGPVVAVSGAADCTAALLRAASPSAALVATPLVGHSGEVTAADVHPTGCVVATGARDGSLRLWDAESGRAAAVFTHAELGPVTAMQFHPDGLFAVVGDAEGRILLIELIELKVAGTMHGHKAAVTAVACSPKGYILATGDAAGQVCVWDLRTQTVITTLAPGAGSATEGAPVLSLRFDGASGSALIAALGSGFVAYKAGKTWSVVATALPLDAASADAAHACIGALFGPNLGSVVTAGAGKDRTLRVFNV